MLELDRAKGEFVSAVSHELRTPLTSIVGYTELLTDDFSANLTALQQQLIERIERNGERLLHLVEDLLTLARVEDGSLSLDRIPTDLRDAVRNATDEVSHAAHKGRVALRVHLPPEPVVLEGDAAYLERLVLNLVSNAVKFTPEGGSVDVDVIAGPEVAQLRVKDTGMGIPLAEQSRLFQRFFRSSLATEHAIQGTGLGLHIVRSIAEAHQGSADFESTPGVGTTFRILLPMPDPASDEPSGPAGREAGTRRVYRQRACRAPLASTRAPTVAAGGQEATLRTTTQTATRPTTPPATLRMLSVRGAPLGSTKCAFTEAISRRMMVLGLAR